MNPKAQSKLEFHKVLDKLEGLCGSVWGREFVREMEIFTDPAAVREALARTTEARRFIDAHGFLWDFGALGDLREALLKLEGGRVLEPAELETFRSALQFSGQVKGARIDPEVFPVLSEMKNDLFAGTAIARRIEESIDAKAGVVRDNATPELARARKRLRELERSIPESLRKMVTSGELSKVVQDRVVTMRNGRFVIPVKSEHAGEGRWVLQDRSSSGSTSFVEPLELVDENNRLTRERLAEKSEVLRVLRGLSSLLGEHLPEITTSLDALGELDFLLARGRLSRETAGVEPELSSDTSIRIIKGRHPLLSGEVFPIDVNLGGDVRALVITGPNAGGKTVTLKMIGLFQLMAQAGLHVPAAGGTALPVFKDIFAVIGDEQSIEQNLSTFSSHLSEIAWSLDRAGDGSLALIDEICSGTDPEEGTALACAVLKELMDRGAVCAATSHQGGLKNFAGVTPGAENACMAFDEKNRTPAFRVEIGIPGKSYALEVAERVGIEKKLLDSAREYLSSQSRMTERLLADLEEMKSFINIERERIDREKQKLESVKKESERELDDARRRKDQILRNALGEAEKIVNETREKCHELLKGAGTSVSLPKAAEIKGSVSEVKMVIQQKKEKVRPRMRAATPADLRPGAVFQLSDSRETVTFVSGPDRKGRVKVLLGDFTVTTEPANLSLPDSPAAPAPPRKRDYAKFVAEAKGNVKEEINLHGMRVLEALEYLERELETYNLAGASEVRIVHGIGTGALMKAVQEYLEKSPFVRRFEICELKYGGIGATRAFLK